ncbi:MAG: hypothetical protein QHH13_11410 [Melioribacter sp.]|uniref:hypothetical protein n=1 Tax=Rosettibacter primus TaxID=3111523 RepID=UPI00247C2972|nr:hypothetical protein [Melioribacter sp.]
MKYDNEFYGLYENLRSILIQTDFLKKQISKISNSQLREIFSEHLKTCQADLLDFINPVYDLITCDNPEDINYIINSLREEDG